MVEESFDVPKADEGIIIKPADNTDSRDTTLESKVQTTSSAIQQVVGDSVKANLRRNVVDFRTKIYELKRLIKEVKRTTNVDLTNDAVTFLQAV